MAAYAVPQRVVTGPALLLFKVRKVFLYVLGGRDWFRLYPNLSTLVTASAESHSFAICQSDGSMYLPYMLVRLDRDPQQVVILAEADTLGELESVSRVYC